jgi:iron complex transport system substrate-binding protein
MMHWFLAVVLALALVGGCNSSSSKSSQVALPRDDLEREVRLAKVPQRVVVIGPGAAEILFALGAGERLVGRDPYCDFPPQAKKAKVVADYRGPFFEQTVAVRPDLIIAQGETWDKERIEQWQQKCGAPVVALTATTMQQVIRSIEKMGAWLGVQERARQLVQLLRVPPLPSSATAFIEIQRAPQLMTAGRGTLVDDVVQRGGFANIAAQVPGGIEGYKQFNAENLLARQPQVYIVPMAKPDQARALRELRSHPVLKQLACVRAGRVVAIDGSLLFRPGPRLVQGIQQLQKQSQRFAGSLPRAAPTP